MMSHAPVFVVITPIMGALLLGLLSHFLKKELFQDSITIISLIVPLILMLILYRSQTYHVYEMGNWPRPYGLILVVDGLSSVMALIAGIVTVCCFLYSLESKRMLPPGNRYNFLFLFMSAGIYGVFLAGDLVNRYVFFELTIISTYVLLTYKGTKESLRASYNFLIIGSTASFFFLAGIGLLYFNTGLLDMGYLQNVVPDLDENTRAIIFSFLLIAIGMKMGLIPFHTWFTDAHVNAPTPMTAVLAGLTIKTGLYITIKLFSLGFDTFLIRSIVLFLGVLTALIGVLMTLRYTDLKRILAWFAMSQMGLATVSMALWTPTGIAGGIMHMVNHSLFKSLLFLSCGAFAYLHKTRDIGELPLLGSNLILSSGFIVGALAMIGFPPLNGYYSYSIILSGSPLPVYVAVVLTQFITAVSLIRIFTLSSRKKENVNVPESMLMSILVLAGLCIFTGVLAPIWMNNVISPAATAIKPMEFISLEYFNIHGLVVMLTAVLGSLFGYRYADCLGKIRFRWTDGIFTRVPVTDAIRYMILVMAAVLALFAFV